MQFTKKSLNFSKFGVIVVQKHVMEINYKPILFTVLLIWFFTLSSKAQPGYPANGFAIYFKANFINFPDSLNSGNLRARYLDTILTVAFVDNTKPMEDIESLRLKCNYSVLRVDTNNIATLIVYIGSSYGFEECYADELIIKRDSNNTEIDDTYFWYSGVLMFIVDDKIKQFECRNIPDGSWLNLQNIDFNKPHETIVLPSFLGKFEIQDLDINEYRK